MACSHLRLKYGFTLATAAHTPPMEARIQYATTRDGVNIACWELGEGPVLVLMPGIPWSHALLEWQDPDFRDWYERLLRHHRVIRFDGRGSGLSDRDRIDYSLETMLLDLEAVVDRLGLTDFALLGGPQGGPPAIAYAAANPDRVSQLMLWCSFARPQDWNSPQLMALTTLAKADWTLYTETMAHAMTAGWAEGKRASRFAALMREAASIDAFEAMLATFDDMDVTPLLGQIAVPTLILHRRGVPIPSSQVAQSLAARIPGATLALLDGVSSLPFVGDMEPVAAAIDRFTLGHLANLEPQPPAPKTRGPEPVLRIILCSDIAAHTAMMQALGDHKGREVLREHERITREALREYGGSEVKTMGDGFLTSFVSAQRALECATAMQRAFADSPILGADTVAAVKVRIGVNAGEPIAEDDDLYGASVIAAARIAALAEGGEILASNVVRELVAGKGFLFSDRGEAALRGLDDPVRLFQLRWE